MRDLFDQRLTDPTAADVASAYREAIVALNRKQKAGIHSFSERDGELLGRRSVGEREGRYENARPEARRVVGRLSLVWWTSPASQKLVRIRGWREKFRFRGGPEMDEADYRRAEQLDRDSRPLVWHLDPERVTEVTADDESEWVAVCGCGAAGSAESLGWHHGMCGPCADRVAEFGPNAVAHAPGLLAGADFEPWDVMFTSGGAVAVATADDQYRAWDTLTGSPQGAGKCDRASRSVRASVSPDGQFLCVVEDAGRQLSFIPLDGRVRFRQSIRGGPYAATHWTGRPGELIVQSEELGQVTLASATGGEFRSVRELPLQGGCVCAVWPDPTAPRVVFATDHRASVAHIGRDGALTAEARFLLGDGKLNRTGVWEDGPLIVRFTPDGERLLFIRDTEMELRHPAKPKALLQARFPRSIRDAAFSPDYEHLFVLGADGAVSVCNPGTLTSVRARLRWHIGPVSRLAVSPDGQTLATAGAEGVKLWPIGRLMSLLG